MWATKQREGEKAVTWVVRETTIENARKGGKNISLSCEYTIPPGVSTGVVPSFGRTVEADFDYSMDIRLMDSRCYRCAHSSIKQLSCLLRRESCFLPTLPFRSVPQSTDDLD